MGYRSNVTFLIYGRPSGMDCFTMKHIHTAGDRNVFGTAMESAECFTAWVSENTAYLLFEAEDWKWYSGYPAVDALGAFMRASNEFGLAYEFIRIGEDDDDIEVERCGADGGQEVLYLLDLERSIRCDVSPPVEAAELDLSSQPASIAE